MLAVFNSSGSAEIFSNADINPSGFLVSSTAEASAKYSLLLESASFIRLPKIGAKIKQINPIIIKMGFPPLLSLSSELPPPQNNILDTKSESITINPTITVTTADNLMS